MHSESDHSDHFCGATSRRELLKALALGGAAVVAGVGIASPAEALAQEGWRWCIKCQGMFYGIRYSGPGPCPAGGNHDGSQSGHYYIREEGAAPGQQGGWRWCAKCMGLFYSGPNNNVGHCPAGGGHDKTGSAAYAAIIGENAVQRQGGWRWCSKCQGMFYSVGSGGVCPADHTAHDGSTSAHYACLT
jgi:hypothetical protein